MFSVAAIPTYALLIFETPTPASGFRAKTPARAPGFSHYHHAAGYREVF